MNNITDDTLLEIKTKLEQKETRIASTAINFLTKNHKALLGLDIGVFAKLLDQGANNTALANRYDELVASLEWEEKIDFITNSIDALLAYNNEKYKQLVLVTSMLETSGTVLGIIRAFV